MSRTTMTCTEVHCDRCGAGNPYADDEYGASHYSDKHPLAESEWREDDGQDLCVGCYAKLQCEKRGGHRWTPWSPPREGFQYRACEDCDHFQTVRDGVLQP